MSLRFVDGFDHYLAADVLKKWTATGSGPLIGPEYARPGSTGAGMSFTTGASARLRKTLTAKATWTIGFAVNPAQNGTQALVQFLDSAAAEQCSLRTNGSGQFTFTRGGTVLATTTDIGAVLLLSVWQYIEVKATISDAAGAFEVRVNGQVVLAGSSVDTKSHASEATATGITIWATNGGGGTTVDDLYMCDGDGSVNNTFLGPVRVITRRPEGAGNSSQWTGAGYSANAFNVQDEYADGDSTFNMDSTAGHIDLYKMEDLPNGTILGIQANTWARQDAGAARTIRNKWRISSTNYNGATVGVSGSYTDIMEIFETSPATSAAWTVSEFNGVEFGTELVS